MSSDAEPLDWGDGDYARTARTLEPAARVLVDAAGVGPGARVLDVGCGTGNAVLEAAARGARVVGVDPAPALVQLARERAVRAGADAQLLVGDAGDPPGEPGAFDVVLSVFAVIFAPDAERAAAGLLRAARPGGRVALTSWLPEGPIHDLGRLLWTALGLASSGSAPRWGEDDWVRELLRRHGAGAVDVREEALPFAAASPEAWLAEQEEHHPVWRWGRRRLGEERWARLRDESLARLREGNEDPAAFRTTSRYLVVVARR